MRQSQVEAMRVDHAKAAARRGAGAAALAGPQARRRRRMKAWNTPLRFGLVGTGYWARTTHAPSLASSGGIEFVAVWGRNPDAARALAAEHGATAYADFEAFLAGVDGVAFSVPPDVQAAMAARAAAAGKDLLLEKASATSAAPVRALAWAGVAAQGVSDSH